MSKIDRVEDLLKKRFLESLKFFVNFAKNPIHEIKTLPNWGFKHLVFVNLVLAFGSGALSGLLSFNPYHFLFALFLLPFVYLLMSGLLSSFLYYYFQVFEKRTVSFLALMTLVTFANLPFFFFQIGAYYLPPITLLGLAFTGFLLIIGLHENFFLDKKRSIRLVVALFAVIFLVWLWNLIDSKKFDF